VRARAPKIVVGERNPGSGDRLLQLFTKIQAPVVRTSIRVAEMVKYTDNVFHALKVTFANEIGLLLSIDRMAIAKWERSLHRAFALIITNSEVDEAEVRKRLARRH
jgi:UDP-glucose 6-dehydrogenase